MNALSVLSRKSLLAFASGLFVVGRAGNVLSYRYGRQGIARVLVWLMLILFSQPILAALIINQPPAELTWASSTVPARANVDVLRYEKVGFYRYDPTATTSFVVHDGHFADVDSLSGSTPQMLAPLPDPVGILAGMPLPLGTALPLKETREFLTLEPIFIVVEGPILPASAFGVRSDGKRYMAVTVDIDTGDSYTLTLVETAPGSSDYAGYLQPNLPGGPIMIPPGSDINIRYDNYGDVADSDTVNTPWNIDPLIVDNVIAERAANSKPSALPPPGDLFLSKAAARSSVTTGDFLAYELTLENTGGGVAADMEIQDTLPQGFRYRKDSAYLDGSPVADPVIAATGRELIFDVGDLPAGQSLTLRYVVEVTAVAKEGNAVNRAVALNNTVQSNQANAAVQVERPFFDDRAFLMGRVIAGECGEADAPGVEGVRIYLEDGTRVVTDKHGRWHMEGIRPGTHVLQLDTLTLSPRYELRRCHDNTRKAGSRYSRFVDVAGGTLWRENWYLAEKQGIDAYIQQQMKTRIDNGVAVVEVPITNGETAFDTVESELVVPDSLTMVAGSALLDGEPIPEPEKTEQGYRFSFAPEGYFWTHTLSVALRLDPAVKESVEKSIVARTSGVTAKGQRYTVTTLNRLAVNGVSVNDNTLVLQPQFRSMSADLSDADKQAIAQSVDYMKTLPDVSVHVVGHTDSRPVLYRAGRAINDNYALSKARAQSVADYIASLLALNEEDMLVEGRGPDEPVADNNTYRGREKNRRATVTFNFAEKIADASLNVIKGDSGPVRDEQSRKSKAAEKAEPGFVNLADNMTLPQPVLSVTALLDAKLKAKLMLDGKEISAERIGMKMPEGDTGMIRYTWVGVELEQIGDHVLELQGVGPFGNARFKEAVTVRRSAPIKTIRLLEEQGNIADGRTPVTVRLQLLDAFDQPVKSQTELLLESGDLQPLNNSQNDNPLEERGNTVYVDKDGFARFEPVGTAGNYRIRLSTGREVSEELTVTVAPALRDWILVGFAEGTIGYNSLQGNMQSLSDEEEHIYSDGEAAFFARGRVKGEWLLTMAYDSRRDEDDQPLQHSIDPQEWYVLYGDDTQRGHDAASSKKLYLRIEKADYYALFGDYDTGLTTTELSSYQRSLTGAKTEWQGRNMSASAFAAETDQAYLRDDIAGDGTSGLYRLSSNPVVPGSETVRIEVRDRFTNEVLSTQQKTRFIDYQIDYSDGTLYFREPVSVQDSNFNPQRIVVEYEVDSGMDELVYGGRLELHDASRKLVGGVTAVDDNTAGANGTLAGVDMTWKPDESHTVKAEMASTRQDTLTNNSTDNAWLLEHGFTSESLDTRVRLEEKDGGFGLGHLAGDDDDIRIGQASARYRVNEQFAVSGEISSQKVLTSNNQRDVVETRLEYQETNWQLYSGLRHAEDTVDNDTFESQQLIAGGQRSLLDERLLLSVQGETGVSSSDNADYPNRLGFGADYRITNAVTLFARQDFTWGHESSSQETRAGVKATPWQGGTVSTDVSRAQDEYGPRLLAHAGLFQIVKLGNNWTADFGLDRAQTIRDDGASESFDDRRPLANGTRNNDYTAAFVGAGYRTAEWQWTNRIEFRSGDMSDKWNIMSGFNQRLDDTDTLAGRLLHFDEKMDNGNSERSTELDVSYSRRPLSDSWFWLNRTRLIIDAKEDGVFDLSGKRLVNNTHVNLVPQYQHQLSLMYGARYVQDTIDQDRYTGYSDVISAEYRYDIAERWDIGLRGSVLTGWNSDVQKTSYGLMAGYSPVRDVWISLGYNFKGFYDEDFDGAENRTRGFVLNFRVKFDQGTPGRIRGQED